MKNPIDVIGIDTHRDGAVWVSVGRRTYLVASMTDCAFKNYPCFGDTDRLYRFMRRAQRAQAALLERGR